MAIGQLLDYWRFVDQPCRMAVLLPEPPRPDLLDLLEQQSIAVVCPQGNGFTLPHA